jgi:formylglycine-generating enzyme required for sulfatase activity
MVVLPTGEVILGSPAAETAKLGLDAARSTRERPQRMVKIAQKIAMAQTEVTVAQFQAFVEATARRMTPGCWYFVGTEWKFDAARSWIDPGVETSPSHPVLCVNKDDAQAYAVWLSGKTGERYRLASEAEWEFAARGGTTTPWFFGEDASRLCAFANAGDQATARAFGWEGTRIRYNTIPNWRPVPCDDGHAAAAPVKSYPPNAFGLYDMLGNAQEWVEDCWHENYRDGPLDQKARMDGDCSTGVMRGQGWTGSATVIRSAFRLKVDRADRRFTFGFRVVREMESPAGAPL